jgi:hypothetical protein
MRGGGLTNSVVPATFRLMIRLLPTPHGLQVVGARALPPVLHLAPEESAG